MNENIIVTDRDTCKSANIPIDFIHKIEERTQEINGREYPYTRVFVYDTKQSHAYYVDAVESQKKIKDLMEKAKNKDPKPTSGRYPFGNSSGNPKPSKTDNGTKTQKNQA